MPPDIAAAADAIDVADASAMLLSWMPRDDDTPSLR